MENNILFILLLLLPLCLFSSSHYSLWLSDEYGSPVGWVGKGLMLNNAILGDRSSVLAEIQSTLDSQAVVINGHLRAQDGEKLVAQHIMNLERESLEGERLRHFLNRNSFIKCSVIRKKLNSLLKHIGSQMYGILF